MGLKNKYVQSIAISGENLFAGTYSGMWEVPTSQMIIDAVNNDKNQIPTSYVLEQNYPNPFNPNTTITFSLPSKSYVRLKVFDLIGREIASIVDEELSAGTYLRQWTAINISSGIYFYRLQSGSFSETKKMVLLR